MHGWKHNQEWTCDSMRCVGSEEGTSQVGTVQYSNKLGWDIYESCCAESVFERGRVEVDCWVRHLWWSGVLMSWGLSHWLLSLLHQSLSVVDKATFQNCLVAMRPRATKADIPSTHNITTFIHTPSPTSSRNWKLRLRYAFLSFHLALFLTILLVHGNWTGVDHDGHLVCWTDKSKLPQNHCPLDSHQWNGWDRQVVPSVKSDHFS